MMLGAMLGAMRQGMLGGCGEQSTQRTYVTNATYVTKTPEENPSVPDPRTLVDNPKSGVVCTAVLSPDEVREVTRFGIHDEDVFRDMREHWDEDVPCTVVLADHKCEKPAMYVLVCRSCGRSTGATICTPHAQYLATLVTYEARHTRELGGCGAAGPYFELIRVMPL